jgi:hydrogenase maturation protein HypF
MPVPAHPALPAASSIHDIPTPAPHAPVITAALGALHVTPPAVAVSLNCACEDASAPVPEDGVLAIGPDRDEGLAVFRRVLAPLDDGAAASWPVALALLDDSFGGDAPFEDLTLFHGVPVHAIIESRIERRAHRGLGAMRLQHYFEAIGAVALDTGAPSSPPAAAEWNALANRGERGRYRYEVLRAAKPWEIDLRGAVRDVVFEILGGEAPARVSARFQNTVAAALADVVRAIGGARGRMPVLLSGTCFRSGRLAARLTAELSGEFDVLTAP